MINWKNFASYKPNNTHIALKELENVVGVEHLVTQNVDRLHQKAGSERVIELHGNLFTVQCVTCKHSVPRDVYQNRLLDANPLWRDFVYQEDPYLKRPDGDAELGDLNYNTFKVPPCLECGGIMKPTVVFFGENVPTETVERTMHHVHSSDGILVVGTSMTVYSIFRFIKAAAEKSIPISIVNIGPTRGDEFAQLKVEAQSGSFLPQVVKMLKENP
jgi:NAD-dependent deacetylase sirtuin 4